MLDFALGDVPWMHICRTNSNDRINQQLCAYGSEEIEREIKIIS